MLEQMLYENFPDLFNGTICTAADIPQGHARLTTPAAESLLATYEFKFEPHERQLLFWSNGRVAIKIKAKKTKPG